MKGNSEQRRKLLKTAAITGGIAGATGLSETWVKPIINSVVIPAHAQTTETSVSDATATTTVAPVVVVQKFSLVDANPFLLNGQNRPSTNSITDKATSFVKTLGNALIPTASAIDSMNQAEFYLEQLSETVYLFTAFSSTKLSGSTVISQYMTGQLTIGVSTDLMQTACFFGETGPVNIPFSTTLESVTPSDKAIITITLSGDKETVTLFFNPNAVTPTNTGCVSPPLPD